MSGSGRADVLERIERAERDDCPVTALGANDGVAYFLSPSGELRRMHRSDFTAIGLIGLFEGDDAWMIANHQRNDKDGTPINDFSVRGVATALIAACRRAGMYDPALRRCGLGVWRGALGPDGVPAPILHCGDALWWGEGGDETWRPPGLRLDHAIFPARPRCARPALDDPATAEEAAGMRRAIDLWRFAEPMDADLTFGWWGQGFLGELPAWRPHLMGTAEHGSGKTALAELLAAGMGPQAEMRNDFTEAGVRALLVDQSRALILDEVESAAGGRDGTRMQMVIGLIRRMSGSTGAAIVRGSPNQQAHASHVAGSAFMVGINPPPLEPQDRSRIHSFDLVKATWDPDAQAKVVGATEAARALSPRLRGRAVRCWPVFAACVAVWRRALIGDGCDGRQADLYATLLAGRDALRYDGPPDGDTIDQDLRRLRPILMAQRVADDEDGDAAQCWMHLLSQRADPLRSRARLTLGQMVAVAARMPESVYRVELRAYGLRVEDFIGPAQVKVPVLLVATKHSSLSEMFAGTRWAGGGWKTSLLRLGDRQLPEAVPWIEGRAWQFAGPKSRAVAVPAALLPEYEPPPKGAGADMDDG